MKKRKSSWLADEIAMEYERRKRIEAKIERKKRIKENKGEDEKKR